MPNLFRHPTCKVTQYAGYLACEVLKQVQDDYITCKRRRDQFNHNDGFETHRYS